ncbi:hypothetical protein JCM5350_003984 [Sporobolomyces pararoseus]
MEMSTDPSQAAEAMEGEDQQPWDLTRAGKRIAELKEIEDNIAVLLHFAGCALASLHPDPLSSFTSRELEVEGENENENENEAQDDSSHPEKGDKSAEFGKYTEAYYTTLNDIQVGLRTSIRHLRVTRTSPAPLLDPTFGSLASSAGPRPSQVGVGGLAIAELLKPLDPTTLRWDGGNSRRETDVSTKGGEGGNQLSLAARELEAEAWKDLADALDS